MVYFWKTIFISICVSLITSTLNEEIGHFPIEWNDWGNRFLEKYNKEIVLEFYQEVFGNKNVDACDKYISSEKFIQHNPDVLDGLEALKTALNIWFTGQGPAKIDTLRVCAEGDLVWMHVREVDPITQVVTAVIDVFKLRNGKIIEHWDVIQAVPKNATNPHPMF